MKLKCDKIYCYDEDDKTLKSVIKRMEEGVIPCYLRIILHNQAVLNKKLEDILKKQNDRLNT